jgi:hypothetical protein
MFLNVQLPLRLKLSNSVVLKYEFKVTPKFITLLDFKLIYFTIQNTFPSHVFKLFSLLCFNLKSVIAVRGYR